MSFPARVFRILIASPSDVTEERDTAVRAIQEWNDLNAFERQLILLPLRWETHSAPEYGKRPQEIINRQVVDYCDLLVGIFWARIGSPTGVADSGTLEEIERVASDRKPVMLYFSKAKQDPELLDLEQLAKLREFKTKTFPRALVENYSGLIDFKEKLSKQLEIQLRTLLAEESEVGPLESSLRPITDIILHFASPETGKDLGQSLTLETRFIEITNIDEIPDYSVKTTGDKKTPKLSSNALRDANVQPANWLTTLQSPANKDYYRQRVTFLVLQSFFKPVRFWLKNRGGVGARDVYLDISIESDSSELTVISKAALPTSPPSKTAESTFTLWGSSSHATKPDDVIKKGSNKWSTHMEVPALQPQRELSPPADFLIGAKDNSEIAIRARIFADSLPEPLVQELKLQVKVTRLSIPAGELVTEIIKPDG